MSAVHVLVVDGSHWVREEDYREVEQQLAEARHRINELESLMQEQSFALAEARAALREIEHVWLDEADATVFAAMNDALNSHIVALRAAREGR